MFQNYLHRFLFLIVLVICCHHLSAQAPQRINYQAILRDAGAENAVVANTSVSITFEIHETTPDGPVVFTETQMTTTNELGLINLRVGEVEDLSAVDWSGFQKFLTITADVDGGGSMLVGTIPLVSVPYALYAENANFAAGDGIGINDQVIENTGDLSNTNEIQHLALDGNTLSLSQSDITLELPTGADDWGNQSAQTDASLSGDGTAGNPLGIAAQGALTGQALKWNGSQWVPQNDNGQAYVQGNGINIAGNVISNTGDTDASDDITIGSAASGDLTGAYPSPQLNNNAVDSDAIANGSIQGIDLSSMGAQNGQVLQWNGVVWAPANTSSTEFQAGNGISIIGNTISNTGDTDASDDITTGTQAQGDLTGFFPNLQLQNNAVDGAAIADGSVQGADLAQMSAQTGQVLQWNGAGWGPATFSSQELNAGNGINIINDVIINTGDTDASDDITTGTQAQGDLTGFFPNLQLQNGAVDGAAIADGSVQGADLAQMSAQTGQVLQWNGFGWLPATISSQNLTAGNGITIINDAITNTGDTDASDDITVGAMAGGDLAGSFFPNLFLSDGVVDADAIADGSINTSHITDGTLQLGDFSSMGASPGQVLSWNGANWETTSLSSGQSYIAGMGIGFSNDTIMALKDSAIWNATALRGRPIGGMGPAQGQALVYDTLSGEWDAVSPFGDLGGGFDSLTVVGLRGRPIGGMGPAQGQALVYDTMMGSWLSSSPAGDLTGSFVNLTVTGLQGNQLAPGTVAPGQGQALVFLEDGTWGPVAPSGDLSGTWLEPRVDNLLGVSFSGVTPGEGELFAIQGGEWTSVTIDGDVSGTFDALELSYPLVESGGYNNTAIVDMTNSSDIGIRGESTFDTGILGVARDGNSDLPIDVDFNSTVNQGAGVDAGIIGECTVGGANEGVGVLGRSIDANDSWGIGGIFQGNYAGAVGTMGQTGLAGIAGVGEFEPGNNTRLSSAVLGFSNGADFAILGLGDGIEESSTTDPDIGNGLQSAAVRGIRGSSNYSVWMDGNFCADGSDLCGVGLMTIDHPNNPANQTLSHYTVYSPDMKTMYDGVVTTDGDGLATVILPDYFEAMNGDFRYHLTVIGVFAQAIVKEKVANNRFVIQTDQAGVEVSWQITGIRRDPYALTKQVEAVQEKTGHEAGTFIHPELYDSTFIPEPVPVNNHSSFQDNN